MNDHHTSLSVPLSWLRRRLGRARDAVARHGGRAVLLTGRPRAAAGLLRAARANDVRRSLAAEELRRGLALVRDGDHAAAVRPLRSATALDPGHAEAHRRLAACLVALERWAEAVTFLRRCRDRFPEQPAFAAQLGAVLVEFGLPAEAVDVLRPVVDLPGGDPRWLRWYVGALVRAGDREGALAAVERLARRAPDDPRARQTAGLVTLDHGRVEEAVGHLRAACALEPSADRQVWLARALLRAGRPGEALVPARAAVATSAGRDSAHAVLAEALLALERVAEARDAVTEALRLAPGHLHWMILLARVHDAVHDFHRSRELLLDLVGQRQDDAEVLRVVAGYFAGAGDVAQALELAQRLVEVLPDSRAHVLLADYLLRLKRYDESVAALRRAVELDPADAGAIATTASVLERQRRLPEAVERLEAALALRPERVKWRIKAASLRVDLGDLDGAEQHLRAVLARDPGDPTACERLARVLLLRGRDAEAEAFLARDAREPRPAWLAFHGYLVAGRNERAFSYLGDRHRAILADVVSGTAS